VKQKDNVKNNDIISENEKTILWK